MVNILKYIGRGIYHSDKEIECQDSVGSVITEQGRVIMVLSDGCGSCLHAKIASDTVVNTVLNYYSDRETTLSNDVAAKKRFLDLINERLFQKACELSYKDTYEFFATMIFAVIEENYVLVGHIGDGALICYGEHGEVLFESVAENGEDKYETYFVNSYDALSHFRLDLLELEEKNILRNLVMYSDGPEKMFDNHIESGLNEGAASLVENTRNNNITDCEQLGKYLHSIFNDALSNAADDWSLLVYDRDQSVCVDFNPEPVVMASVFYENYPKSYPIAENSITHKQGASKIVTETEEKEFDGALVGYEEQESVSDRSREVDEEENDTENEYDQGVSEQISFIEKNIEDIYSDFEGVAYKFNEIRDIDHMKVDADFINEAYVDEYPNDCQDQGNDIIRTDVEEGAVADEVKQDKKTDGKLKSLLKKFKLQ